MGIFEGYRALGYITDGTPFCVDRRGMETFLIVSVGKAFQIFNCAKLSLILVSPQLEKKIRALAAWRDFTYVATGCSIAVFKRAHQVSMWNAHKSKVVHLLVFGNHILSLDTSGELYVWEATNVTEKSPVPLKKLQLGEAFSPTSLVHPETYLNKILVSSEEGSLALWNINTEKMLYQFKGWGSPICCCVSSPALDVVGVGCADGKIHLHNLRFDESVVTFTHTTKGSVTSLSFRTDGQPLLAAGGSSGVISIWNLEKQKLQSVIKDAHDSMITSLYFFPNEPVLLSSGKDNSLKMWIFDSNDGEARLLRFRSGHSAPPACIRYYAQGRSILSAGQDRAFRLFSTIQDQQSRELSQGHVARKAKKLKIKEKDIKLPPVVSFAAAEIRERDWCNVVTCHMDENAAYSWRLQNFVIGDHVLKPALDDPSPVKACTISVCGNFAVLGTELGYIERFNLQSGIHRGSYCDAALGLSKAHAGSVVGVATDSTNGCLISGGYDSFIKVWDFKSCSLKSSWSVGSPLVKMVFHHGNGLLAVASDDLIIRLYDVIAKRLVRQFQGHTDRITDLCFSEDGKWSLSSSMDGTVRVWDIVSAKQIDAMHVDSAVTGISFSPAMDMLATTHVGHIGIYLWANRLMYSGVPNSDYGSGKTIVKKVMPTVSSLENEELEPEVECALRSKEEPGVRDDTLSKPDLLNNNSQILPTLVTLSMLPKAQWQSLVNLDIIKTRNKPIAPPEKPERAPFFLPTIPTLTGGEPVFVKDNTTLVESPKQDEEQPPKSSSRRFHTATNSARDSFNSSFLHQLHACSENMDYSSLLSFLRDLSPSEIDLEFRMLQIIDDVDMSSDRSTDSVELQEISMLLDFLIHELSSNRDFDFLQALLRLFLKIHGETIVRHPFLQEKVKLLLNQQKKSWEKLDAMFQNVRCMISFHSNSFV